MHKKTVRPLRVVDCHSTFRRKRGVCQFIIETIITRQHILINGICHLHIIDRLYDLGYYFEGGTLMDEENVLTSDWGEYSPATKQSVFNHDVKLVNPKFVLTSDTLRYNTESKIAVILGPSNIVSIFLLMESVIFTLSNASP